MNELKAVLLVGGEATRLQPLSNNEPKALLPIRQLPIIEYMFEKFVEVGIDNFLLIAADKHREQWENYNNITNYKVEVFYEKQKYGTAGFIINNLDLFPDIFICANGDLLMDLNLDFFLDTISKTEASILSTIEVTDPSRFGLVVLDDNNLVKEFIEKPQDLSLGNTISTGLYFFRLEDLKQFNSVLSKQISFEKDVFPSLSKLSLLTNCSLQGELFDVGTRDSYIEANCRDNDYWVHPSAIVHETVQLKQSVIMENSEVGENSLIVNSIISPEVKLEPNSIIEDEIIC